MVLNTVQLIVIISIAAILVAGVLFIISDARAYKRRSEEYSVKKRSESAHQEHEVA